ncbi:MAG: N-acetylmuramoyl-L-alanine amidase [Verrucomicrobia bacterium]|nr:N-acetylmuramoyl-L-alanine amidase [Verrucomicrobiota bacterium]
MKSCRPLLASLLLFALGPSLLPAQRLSGLGERPDWTSLKAFQETMSRDEFERLLRTLYAPGGGWEPFIRLREHEALLVTDSNTSAPPFVLRFARTKALPAPPRYWKPAVAQPAAARPLAGVRIALDPGHLGGAWARMEERWFQLEGGTPVMEGELTLKVAELLAPKLEALGAEVLWVRRSSEPATTERPDDLRDRARAALKERGIAAPPENYTSPADPEREKSVAWEAERFFYRLGEIRARGRKVNEDLKPDLTLCLHFNAEEWGDPAKPKLIDHQHLHMLINGNYWPTELRYDDVRFELLQRLLQRVHEEEIPLGESVGAALQRATDLDPYVYPNDRARRVRPASLVWARNLLANRLYRSPVVYCEPYVMNSLEGHARIQAGDYEGLREVAGQPRPSIFREYAQAVADGLAWHYRNRSSAR